VTSNQPQGASEPGSTSSLRLVLELVQDDGATASGTVGPVDGSEPIRFHGWIGLMSAVNSLRARSGRPPPSQEDGPRDRHPA